MINTLIVGQGLAGSLMAMEIEKRKLTYKICDPIQFYNIDLDGCESRFNSATLVSTGIMNPVTGRRFNKSWMIDQLLPEAEACYKSLEQQFNQSFIYSKKIFRTFTDQKAENDWAVKCLDEAYINYTDQEAFKQLDDDKFLKIKNGMQVKGGFWVDLNLLISSFRKYFESKNQFINTSFNFNEVEISGKGVKVVLNGEPMLFERVIFCEGFRVVDNPFFNHLPYTCSRGEVLIIKCPGLDQDRLVKHQLFFIPLGKDVFKIGTTWHQGDHNPFPSDEGKTRLTQQLDQLLKLPYEILEHQSGTRPTIKDRRPVLGAQTEHENLFLFNGLGTKGVSLSPFFSKHLAEHIFDGKDLIEEVDISRFD